MELTGTRRTPAKPLAVDAVLTQLADLGPPSEIRSQSPTIAAVALGFDRVLLTSIRAGMLEAEALYVAANNHAERTLARLHEHPVALDYPLIEGEIMRRRRAEIVRAEPGDTARERAFGEVLAWTEYVAAPIALDGQVVGFFHADRQSSGRPLEQHDARGLSSFALCFALVFERAVLRHRLRIQTQEMREVASWADARTSELGDRSISLTESPEPPAHAERAVRTTGIGEHALRDLLTHRELDVLRLMVRGQTNAAIAKDLVVSEGTVKFHVKNILRKLHAANRAEATSRYLRLTLNRGDASRS